MKKNPATFKPSTPKELIGSAGQFAASLLKHILDIKDDSDATLKLAFRGDPGTGKTTLVNMISLALASNKFDVETINGRNLTIDVVRDWQKNACYGSLFGGWKIKIINEMDLIPATAQDLILSYLDELPAKTAVLGSSNASASNLSDRFATRFQLVFVKALEQKEIASFLIQKFGVPKKAADFIAFGCLGNVRQALLDAASFITLGILPEKIEHNEKPVCSARSAAALKAWDTMRAKAA